MSYLVITPARNEQDNIGHTIRSMAAQTHRPSRWVIVNDGSTDETGRIIDEAAREHSWITPVHRKDRGFRQQGGGVIEAFYEGYALLHSERRAPARRESVFFQAAEQELGAPAHGEPSPPTLEADRGHEPRGLLSRPLGTLSSALSGGEGWGEEVHGKSSPTDPQPSTLNPQPSWNFLVKFDADLSFGPDYFERCLDKFSKDPKLGIGGGMIAHEVEGRLVCESPGDPAFHVRGATKIYQRACWEAIGGLIQAPGWDTIDELKANMLGWSTLTFRDIPLRHHRFTGTADGAWKNYVKFGLSNYITGYHPLFMFLKCVKRTFSKPVLVGAAGLFWGFCRGYLKREKQVADPDLIRYVRQQQLNKLTFKPSLW